jgi:hypothetical protein
MLWIGTAFGVSLGLAMAYASRAMPELFGLILEPLARAWPRVWLGLCRSTAGPSRPDDRSLPDHFPSTINRSHPSYISCWSSLHLFAGSGFLWRISKGAWLDRLVCIANRGNELHFVRLRVRLRACGSAWTRTLRTLALGRVRAIAAMSVAAPLLVLAAAAHRRLGKRYNQVILRPVTN